MSRGSEVRKFSTHNQLSKVFISLDGGSDMLIELTLYSPCCHLYPSCFADTECNIQDVRTVFIVIFSLLSTTRFANPFILGQRAPLPPTLSPTQSPVVYDHKSK